MSPDHDCVDGICSDGDFMLTDIPEFSMVFFTIILLYFLTFNLVKIHIHSVDHHSGIIAEEFDKGTTINTYIGVSTETPSTPNSRVDDDEDVSDNDTSSVADDVTEGHAITEYASTSSTSSKPTSAVTVTSISIMSTISPASSSTVLSTAQSDELGDVTLPVIRPTTQSPRVELEATTRSRTTPPTVVTSITSTTAVETLSVPEDVQVDEEDDVDLPDMLLFTTIPSTTEANIFTFNMTDVDPFITNSHSTAVITSVPEVKSHGSKAGTTYSSTPDTSTSSSVAPGSSIATEPVGFVMQTSTQPEPMVSISVTADENMPTFTSTIKENLTNLELITPLS